jgi:Fur family transcriptional regulator, ferric uptake regulator
VEKRIEAIKKHLYASCYKLTPQREATVRVLILHEENHLSAEDIYILVKQDYPEIGLATVYRTLELLNDLKIVEKINFGDGVSRYDVRDNSKSHHHHLICTECGSVSEVVRDFLAEAERLIYEESKFEIHEHRLSFYGKCLNCQSKGRDKTNET